MQESVAASPRQMDGEVIELRVPASPAHLPVVRTLAADIAARLDFNLDDVADLRMAVDEACSVLVSRVSESQQLTCTFDLQPDILMFHASAYTNDGRPPARDTFGWQVLTALVDEADATADGQGQVTVSLGKRRSRTDA